jgi:hypothetical protein
MGFFGLAHSAYSPLVANDRYTSVSVVEGEHDQLALFQSQTKQGLFDEIFLALGGSGHNGLDALARVGITRAAIIGDDDAGGYDFPVSILKKTRKVSCKVFNWPLDIKNPAGTGMDPDEAVKLFGFSKVYTHFLEDDNYVYAPRWCYNRAKVRLTQTNEDDVVQQEAVAVDVGSLLKMDVEQRSFAELFAKDFPLLSPINIVRAVSKNDDTALGFITNIASWIRKEFHVMYVDNQENILQLWHTNKREKVPIAIGLKAGVTTFKAYIPTGILYEWARDEIGLPGYFPDITNPEATQAALDKSHQLIETALQNAFSVLASETISLPEHLKGQGIHVEDVAEDDCGYVVNGNRVYRLDWHADGEQLKSAIELPGPSDDGNVFDLAKRITKTKKKGLKNRNPGPESDNTWLPFIYEAEDFLKPPKYSLPVCFNHVRDILNLTCEFQHQKADITYSALLVFYSYLLDCMPRRVMTHILGEHESGKTTYLSMLCRHPQMATFALTYHADTADNYSPVGIFQRYQGTRFLVGLDEANDPDDGSDQSRKIKTLYTRIRGLSNTGVADYTIGTTDRQGNRYCLYNAMITAGSTVLTDPMDLSRFHTLTLKKNLSKADTSQLLLREYGEVFFEDLRQSIALNSIRIAPKVARAYLELPTMYSKETKNSPHQLDRFLHGLLPLAAIGKVIGADYHQFLVDFCDSRKQIVRERKENTAGQELFNVILSSPHMQIGFDSPPVKKSLRTALNNPQYHEYINQSDSGVYYDEVSECVGVAWEQCKQALLMGTRYGRQAAASLASISHNAIDRVSPEYADRSGIQMRLNAVGMAGASYTTVFTVSSYLRKAEAASEFRTQMQQAEEEKALEKVEEKKSEKDNEGNDDDPLSGANL